MGRRRGAKSVGEVHPPTLVSTLCPTLSCDLVPRFSTGISLDLGICSPPRRSTEGVVEVRPGSGVGGRRLACRMSWSQ